MRFPTEVDILFGDIGPTYSNLNPSNRIKAERWRSNYLKSFDEMIERLNESDLIVDPDIIDKLDDIRWTIAESDIGKFLEGQDKYPEELSVAVNYTIFQQILNAERIINRWGDIFA